MTPRMNYNQTFSSHIIKLDLENNSKANTQSNSNDNVGTFNLSHGEECIQKDVLQEINHSGIKKKANSSYDDHLNTSKNFVCDSNSSSQINNNSLNYNEGENTFQ